MRRVGRRRWRIWLELRLLAVKRQPVAPMLAANSTGLQTRRRQEEREEKRQEKRQEKTVSLKIVACGYRLGFNSKGGGAVVV
jgi:nitroreductase